MNGTGAEAWPIWHCPACRRPNDQLRHTCRYCAAHRPCEHVADGRRCGAVPVGMYPNGPKCGEHGPTAVGGTTVGLVEDAVELGDEFTVGQWALGVAEQAFRTPRRLLDSHGRWRPNPDYATAVRAAAQARVTVAHHLGIPLDELGSCAACRAPHHRYGDEGGPLCPGCLAGTEVGRAWAAARRLGLAA